MRCSDESAHQRNYRAALKRGRALENKNDFAGAQAAFKEALTAERTDATAFSELSNVDYSLKDFAGAIDAATQALTFAPGDAALRSAAYYNRGHAKEALGKKADAVDDYVLSLRARNRRVVRDHLAALDAARASAFDPFLAKVLTGPSPLDKFCTGGKKSKLPTLEGEGSAPDEGVCDNPVTYFQGPKTALSSAQGNTAGTMAEIRLTADTDYFEEGHGTDTLNVMVRTDRGWWRAPAIDTTWTNEHCDDKATIGDWSITDNGTRAVLRINHHADCQGNGSADDVDTDSVAIIGIGKSGKPYIVGPVETMHATEEDSQMGEVNESVKKTKLEYKAHPFLGASVPVRATG